mmetsp:Transcript_15495/g.24127  ORF Transcript_15495/g.24127 Transcript_15495/m.24127 type:complete len:85 (+) Transcript_15495:811-1065(+)
MAECTKKKEKCIMKSKMVAKKDSLFLKKCDLCAIMNYEPSAPIDPFSKQVQGIEIALVEKAFQPASHRSRSWCLPYKSYNYSRR